MLYKKFERWNPTLVHGWEDKVLQRPHMTSVRGCMNLERTVVRKRGQTERLSLTNAFITVDVVMQDDTLQMFD